MLITISVFKFFTYKNYKNELKKPVSIIVPFRNEETNIKECIKSLIELKLPDSSEIIFVNDHSEDDSVQILNNYLVKYDNISCLSLNKAKGKKQAVLKGIENASNEIIVTLDADCKVKANWIKALTAPFINENVKMVVGYIQYDEDNFYSIFNQLEWNAMFVLNFFHRPIVCSGANLAFKKSFFSSLKNPFNMEVESGDDVYLMHNVLKKNKNSVKIVISAQVNTKAPQSFNDFIMQKVRWFKKNSSVQSLDSLLIGFLITTVNIFSVINLILFFVSLNYNFLWFVVIKSIIDFLLLTLISCHYKQYKNLWSLPLIIVIYPIYFLMLMLASHFFQIKWKGRTI